MVIGRVAEREAAALVEDGRLEDLLVAAPPGRPVPGAIYRATAGRPAKGQGGVFVTMPGGSGFLRGAARVVQGRSVLVQVTGFAESGKAPPVTSRLLFKGRYVILTPAAPGRNVSRQVREPAARERLLALAARLRVPDHVGLILRSAAAAASEAEVEAECAGLSAAALDVLAAEEGPPELLHEGPGPHALARRDWPSDEVAYGADAFGEHGLEDVVAALLRPTVALTGQGRMHVEPTRALVAVDIDTGGDLSPAAGLKANIEAARVLPRELRCRGLGGQIVIDFAPVAKRDRARVEQALAAALRSDPVETRLVGWTPLSHMELQRKRERLPLSEALGRIDVP